MVKPRIAANARAPIALALMAGRLEPRAASRAVLPCTVPANRRKMNAKMPVTTMIAINGDTATTKLKALLRRIRGNIPRITRFDAKIQRMLALMLGAITNAGGARLTIAKLWE